MHDRIVSRCWRCVAAVAKRASMERAALTPDRFTLTGKRTINCVSFYCPGTGLTPSDKRTNGGPFSNFYPLTPNKLTLNHAGASAEFANSEAAYQSLKWWADELIRAQFVCCDADGLQGGEDAFQLKRKLERSNKRRSQLAPWEAMLLVLRAKFRLPGFRELLLSSSGLLLVEHCPVAGRDLYWSDNHSGGGQNRLGAALMLVRDELLAEDGQPSGWPAHVPRPEWAGAAGAAAAGAAAPDTAGWQSLIDEVAALLCAADLQPPSSSVPPSPPPSPPATDTDTAGSSSSSSSSLAKLANYGSWSLLSVVFAAAAYQGAEFASTKPSATAWGGVIGFAAFLAWLAVDEEEACEGGGAQEDEDAALDLDDDDDEPVAESHAKSD